MTREERLRRSLLGNNPFDSDGRSRPRFATPVLHEPVCACNHYKINHDNDRDCTADGCNCGGFKKRE